MANIETWLCIQQSVCAPTSKAHSHRAKAKKNFLDVSYLFIDLFWLFFDLFRFRLVWINPFSITSPLGSRKSRGLEPKLSKEIVITSRPEDKQYVEDIHVYDPLFYDKYSRFRWLGYIPSCPKYWMAISKFNWIALSFVLNKVRLSPTGLFHRAPMIGFAYIIYVILNAPRTFILMICSHVSSYHRLSRALLPLCLVTCVFKPHLFVILCTCYSRIQIYILINKLYTYLFLYILYLNNVVWNLSEKKAFKIFHKHCWFEKIYFITFGQSGDLAQGITSSHSRFQFTDLRQNVLIGFFFFDWLFIHVPAFKYFYLIPIRRL